MTYPEAIQFLYGLRLFGAKFGLENTRKLAALAGHPQEKLRFIHVAGTNGKGSTCAMLESIYRASGLRVGLFTSPHLVSFRERIQVNRQLISEKDVVRLVQQLRRDRWESRLQAAHEPAKAGTPNADGVHPTFFEFVTVMALTFFAEQKCDLVILETGLGGRLDATNIVTPLASVITNIAFDHEQWLGDTLEKIAAEKAGIIKPGVPVLTATDSPEALSAIKKIAREKNAPLTLVADAGVRSSAFRRHARGGRRKAELQTDETLSLLGEHQKVNAALARATVEILQPQIPVNEEKIRAGLAAVNWPGRLQLVTRPGGQKILLDGAHNVAGAEALRAALLHGAPSTASARFQSQPKDAETVLGAPAPVLIFGALADKKWLEICRILAPLAARVFTVPVASERTAAADELAGAFHAANPKIVSTAAANLAEALNACKDKHFVVITGSLYLVGEALELLGLSPAGGGERGLNEWTAPKKTAISPRQIKS